MRLKTDYALKDREGEEKIVRKFLWFPLYFDKEKEKRWLEVADVVYQVKKVDIGDMCSVYVWKWRKERFATDEDYRSLSFIKSFDDGFDLFERTIRNPITWLLLDFMTILIVSWNLKNAVAAFLMLKIVQCITLAMFRDCSNEV